MLIVRCSGVTSGHLMGEDSPARAGLGEDLYGSIKLARLVAHHNRCGTSSQKAVRDLAASFAPPLRKVEAA